MGAKVFGVVCVCLSLAFSSIGRAQADPINVFVSVLPPQYFAERVGGERVRVSVMVGPGQSPATYEPTPRQMAQLSQAAIYWRMGSPFEDVWMKRIMAANPRMQVIDVRDGIAVRQMEDLETVLASDADLERHEHGDHSGREAYRHHAGQRDPHIWLSPPRVMRVTAHFKQALVALDPKHHAEYEANYTRFTQELEQLHRDIKTLLAEDPLHAAVREVQEETTLGELVFRHMLFLDGVYVERPDRSLRFRWVKAPSGAELIRLNQTLARRIGRYLERQGLLERDAENSYLVGDELEAGPMEQLLGSSITYRIAVGPQQGRQRCGTCSRSPGADPSAPFPRPLQPNSCSRHWRPKAGYSEPIQSNENPDQADLESAIRLMSEAREVRIPSE